MAKGTAEEMKYVLGQLVGLNSPNSILKPLSLHLSGLNIPCKGTISALPPVRHQSALKPWMQPQNRELVHCAAA